MRIALLASAALIGLAACQQAEEPAAPAADATPADPSEVATMNEPRAEKRPHELAPPLHARCMRPGQVRARLASPEPESILMLDTHLIEGEAAQLQVGDAAGKRLRALLEQLR